MDIAASLHGEAETVSRRPSGAGEAAIIRLKLAVLIGWFTEETEAGT